MKKRKFKSVAFYIVIPVIILGVLSVISAYISLTSLGSVNDASKKIYDGQLGNITVLDKISVSNERIQKLTLNLFLSGNKEAMEQAWADVENATSEAEALMEQLDKAFKDDETSEVFKTYRAHFTAFLDNVDSLKTLAYSSASGSGTNYANYSHAREVTRWSDILQEDIDKIIQANDNVTDGLKARLNSVYNTSKSTCIVIVAVTGAVIIFVIVIIIRKVITPLKRMNGELDIIINSINSRSGDLSKRISVKSSNEIGRVSANINEFISKLENIMKIIISNSKKLDSSINNVASKAGTANASACDISVVMEELSAAMEEVTATAHDVNEKTVNANGKVNNMAEETEDILEYTMEMNKRATNLENIAKNSKNQASGMVSAIIQELKGAMEKSREVEKVSQLTTDILKISSKTNLLSLNASVEAARAGEAGKGFAVVAEEIRRLAGSCKNTANNIQGINEMVVEAVNGLINSCNKIVDFIDGVILPDYDSFVEGGQQYNKDATHVNDIMKNFAALSKELYSIIDSITSSVNGITIAVEESADGVASAAASVDSLVSDIGGVNKEMETNSEISSKFKEETDCFVNL